MLGLYLNPPENAIVLCMDAEKAIRRGAFKSVPDLIDAIVTHLAAHNDNPQPFQWTATTDQILEKVKRGRVTLDAITHQTETFQ